MNIVNFLIFRNYVILIAIGYCLLLGLITYTTKLFKFVVVIALLAQVIFLSFYLKTGAYLYTHSASLKMYNEFYHVIKYSWFFFSLFLLLVIFCRLLSSLTFKEQNRLVKFSLIALLVIFPLFIVKKGLIIYIILYYGFAP